MPYIPQIDRKILEDPTYAPDSSGELNYAITKLCTEYFNSATRKNYAALNEIMGALECAKIEFYRRMIAPYEDVKREENGDVYPQ